jgi:hypothetical protein
MVLWLFSRSARLLNQVRKYLFCRIMLLDAIVKYIANCVPLVNVLKLMMLVAV